MYTGVQSTDSMNRISNYVLNEKSDSIFDRCIYTSGHGCSVRSVRQDFADLRDQFDPNERLKVEAFALVFSASFEEFDPQDPEQMYQLHQVNSEVLRRAFPGRPNLAGTQIDGSTGLGHTHGIVSNIAMEDAVMTHTIKGEKVKEQVVAGKPFSSAMSNVFRLRAVTNEVLADEEFMASVGYDNSRLGGLMAERAGLDGKVFSGLRGKHAYDNHEVMRVSRGGHEWLRDLKARIKDATAKAQDQESFVALLTEDGTVAFNPRSKKTWTFKYTEENGRVHSSRAGSKRLQSVEFGKEAILKTIAEAPPAGHTTVGGEIDRLMADMKLRADAGAQQRAQHEAAQQAVEQSGKLSEEPNLPESAVRDAKPVKSTTKPTQTATTYLTQDLPLEMKFKLFREHGEVLHDQIPADDQPLPKRKHKPVVEEPEVVKIVAPAEVVEQVPQEPVPFMRPLEVAKDEPELEQPQEPVIEDASDTEDRRSLLWNADFDSHSTRKQKIIVAVAAFEEQHAWPALAQGLYFDDSKVPDGAGRAWMEEFSGQLDPAVSEQLWLRVELKDERAAEFEHGRTARDAGDTRTARLSQLRRTWLESQLEAGRYDTSGEDRKAYLHAYIQERAASIDSGDPEGDVQAKY